MSATNSIHLIGRAGGDPVSRETTAGKTIVSLNIAVDRARKNDKNERVSDWFTLKGFGKTGEAIQRWGRKGLRVSVNGELQLDKYTDRQGVERTSLVVIVDHFSPVDWPDKDEASSGGGQARKPHTPDPSTYLSDDDVPSW